MVFGIIKALKEVYWIADRECRDYGVGLNQLVFDIVVFVAIFQSVLAIF